MTPNEIAAHYPDCPQAVAFAEQYDANHPGLFAALRESGASPKAALDALKPLASCGILTENCARCQMDKPSFLVYLRAKLGAM